MVVGVWVRVNVVVDVFEEVGVYEGVQVDVQVAEKEAVVLCVNVGVGV